MSATLLDIEAVRNALHGAAATARILRRAGRDAVPGHRDRRHRRLSPAVEREHRRAYETSRITDALVADARDRAASFLGCAPEETIFGPTMTNLNFNLTRCLARELRSGDEVVVTQLDHDANVAPWLELAHDAGIVVRFARVRDDLSLDLDDLQAQLTDRTRVVAFPAAANSVGTAPDVRRVVELAHDAGALAWVDAVHYGPHGPIDVAAWGCDVLVCSPYKYFGRISGSRSAAPTCSPLAAVQGAPVGRRADRPPIGDGDASSTSCSPASSPRSTTCTSSAGTRSSGTSGRWESASSTACRTASRCMACRRWRAACRRSASPSPPHPEQAAVELAARDLAVWHGNYYALDDVRALGLAGRGRVRAGLRPRHDSAEEVDRLLAALGELAAPGSWAGQSSSAVRRSRQRSRAGTR